MKVLIFIQEMKFVFFFSSYFNFYEETPLDVAIKNRQYEAAQMINPEFVIPTEEESMM